MSKSITIEEKNWAWEWLTPSSLLGHKFNKIIMSQTTAYQKMRIIETQCYGKCLILDDNIQSSTKDEFIYHESLVQPAMIHHGSPRKVLILGGAEGATLREVLRWKTVEQLVMVDIDGEVVEACRQYLPEMHQGAFDDPRVEVIIDDALNFVETTSLKWDVIISDISDPLVDSPSYHLFTQEYFQTILNILSNEGAFVMQAGSVSPVSMGIYVGLINTLSTVFPHTLPYSNFISSFGEPWGFALTSNKPFITRPEPEQIDQLLALKTTGGLRMLDGISLLGMLQLPAHLRHAIAQETAIYTLANPPQHIGQGILGTSA
ncbi:MAG TPA: spermidine synthase [Cyanothece sp. UBA12306]|nr:spermidine synthase [Cyanothece sp. UBA12306]